MRSFAPLSFELLAFAAGQENSDEEAPNGGGDCRDALSVAATFIPPSERPKTMAHSAFLAGENVGVNIIALTVGLIGRRFLTDCQN